MRIARVMTTTDVEKVLSCRTRGPFVQDIFDKQKGKPIAIDSESMIKDGSSCRRWLVVDFPACPTANGKFVCEHSLDIGD